MVIFGRSRMVVVTMYSVISMMYVVGYQPKGNSQSEKLNQP